MAKIVNMRVVPKRESPLELKEGKEDPPLIIQFRSEMLKVRELRILGARLLFFVVLFFFYCFFSHFI